MNLVHIHSAVRHFIEENGIFMSLAPLTALVPYSSGPDRAFVFDLFYNYHLAQALIARQKDKGYGLVEYLMKFPVLFSEHEFFALKSILNYLFLVKPSELDRRIVPELCSRFGSNPEMIRALDRLIKKRPDMDCDGG